MKDSLWSVDLFRCESIFLKTHWVLFVMDQFTRRIIGFGVHAGDVDGPALCRMFNQATNGKGAPRYLSSDHDPLYRYHRWRANLRIREVQPIKTVPYVPVSHPFTERIIGTIRREYLDQILFWSERDLEEKLEEFQAYYNAHRVHQSLNLKTPDEAAGMKPPTQAELRNYSWGSHCKGLFQTPIAA
jgi:transposase InsO family protein